MELLELENALKAYNKKMSENFSLDRTILKRFLLSKSKRHVRVEKLKTIYQLSSPILLPLLLFAIMEIRGIDLNLTTNFYIGLALFLPAFLYAWALSIKHYMLIRAIDFSVPVVHIKKQIAELEKYTIRMNRTRNMLMPLPIVGMLLMFVPRQVYLPQFSVMLLLVVIIFVGSVYYRSASIRKRYEEISENIRELEALEK